MNLQHPSSQCHYLRSILLLSYHLFLGLAGGLSVPSDINPEVLTILSIRSNCTSYKLDVIHYAFFFSVLCLVIICPICSSRHVLLGHHLSRLAAKLASSCQQGHRSALCTELCRRHNFHTCPLGFIFRFYHCRKYYSL